MPVVQVPASGLTRRQRLRAILPVLVVLAALIGFGVYVQRGKEFSLAYHKLNSEAGHYPMFYPMIAAGLRRIESAGYELSWFYDCPQCRNADKYTAPPKLPPPNLQYRHLSTPHDYFVPPQTFP